MIKIFCYTKFFFLYLSNIIKKKDFPNMMTYMYIYICFWGQVDYKENNCQKSRVDKLVNF